MVIRWKATTTVYPASQGMSIPFKTPRLRIVGGGRTPSRFYQECNFWGQ